VNASYGVRLLCLSLTCLVLVNFLAGGLVRLLLPWALPYIDRLSARRASWVLLVLRLAPAVTAWLAVAAFCIPSYLELEPRQNAEQLTMICVLAALAGAMMLLHGVGRALLAVFRTRRLAASATRCSLLDEAYVVAAEKPLIAMAGVLRPRLVISPCVLEALSAEELDSAVRHEQAHRRAGDNLKRLVMLLASTGLPWSKGFAVLERQLARTLEWAADDEATGGDPARCVALAAALVRVARLGSAPVPATASSLVSADCSLQARVQRLLHGRPQSEPVSGRGWLAAVALALMLGAAAYPSSLPLVHVWMERLLG
jgi:BlaR1 peptidase M56